jgi:hypothetical protein
VVRSNRFSGFVCENESLLLALAHRLDATGADVLADFATTHHHRHFLNIRPEYSFGAPHGKAHVIARRRFLAADLTFSHNFTSIY